MKEMISLTHNSEFYILNSAFQLCEMLDSMEQD